MKKLFRYHIRSFGHAFTGLRTLFRSEHNMRIHTLSALMAVVLAWWYKLSVTRWCLLLAAIALVLICEALNTAIERLCDVVSPEKHPVIKQVKDISAAAVLIAATGAVVTGLLLFFC